MDQLIKVCRELEENRAKWEDEKMKLFMQIIPSPDNRKNFHARLPSSIIISDDIPEDIAKGLLFFAPTTRSVVIPKGRIIFSWSPLDFNKFPEYIPVKP